MKHFVIQSYREDQLSLESKKNSDITVNKNMVPFDDKSPFVTSGIRIGTAAVTTRGLDANDMIKIVDFIDQAIVNCGNEIKLNEIGKEVNSMMSKYPLFSK